MPFLESAERRDARLARRAEHAAKLAERTAKLAARRADNRAFIEQVAEKRAAQREAERPILACPHCLTMGAVTAKRVTAKQGISGGKATGAVLTGGASLLLTGLSRKQRVTRMHCAHCGLSWTVQ